jgi:hypothetical protein
VQSAAPTSNDWTPLPHSLLRPMSLLLLWASCSSGTKFSCSEMFDLPIRFACLLFALPGAGWQFPNARVSPRRHTHRVVRFPILVLPRILPIWKHITVAATDDPIQRPQSRSQHLSKKKLVRDKRPGSVDLLARQHVLFTLPSESSQ